MALKGVFKQCYKWWCNHYAVCIKYQEQHFEEENTD